MGSAMRTLREAPFANRDRSMCHRAYGLAGHRVDNPSGIHPYDVAGIPRYTETIWSSSFFDRLVMTSGAVLPTITVSSCRKPPTP